MKNVKVKGVFDQDGVKNYEIKNTDTGEIHIALRVGQKYELGQFVGTLGDCKKLVSECKVVHFADKNEEVEPPRIGPWDNLNPAAALVLWADKNPHVERILDNMGACDENGQPDLEWAKDELKRWEAKLGASNE